MVDIYESAVRSQQGTRYNDAVFARRTEWKLAPNRLTQKLRHLRAAGAEILDLTESNPTRCDFRYEGARILAALSHP